MAAAPPPEHCPVCYDEFKEPKLLPCYHVMCGKCVLDWLSVGQNMGCPLCRAPILAPSAGPLPRSHADLVRLVDALPTDLVIQPTIRDRSALDTGTTLLCDKCGKILCATCVLNCNTYECENVSLVSSSGLSGLQHVDCSRHDETQSMCWTHKCVICESCARTAHCLCSVQTVQEAAAAKKKDLAQHLEGCRRKEQLVTKKIREMKAELLRNYASAEDCFNTLLQCITQHNEELNRTLELAKEWVDFKARSPTLAAWAKEMVVGFPAPDSRDKNDVLRLIAMITLRQMDDGSGNESQRSQDLWFIIDRLPKIHKSLTSLPPITFTFSQLGDLIWAISTLGPLSDETEARKAAALCQAGVTAVNRDHIIKDYCMPMGEEMLTGSRLKALGQISRLIFTKLRELVEKRHLEVRADIQKEEHTIQQLESAKWSLQSHARMVESLLGCAPDILLMMKESLASRFQKVKQQVPRPHKVKGPAAIVWDQERIEWILTAISSLGMPSPTLRGAALAQVLKVGDRVKLNVDYHDLPSRAREWKGTVTAISSKKPGQVDVQWDGGGQRAYYMGWGGIYDLDLVSSPLQSPAAPSEWSPEELDYVLSFV